MSQFTDRVAKDAIDGALHASEVHATAADALRTAGADKAGSQPAFAATMAAVAQVDATLALRWEIRAATLVLAGAVQEIARSLWTDPR